MYFLDDSLVHRMMVEIMKMVANTASEAMAIRQWFITTRVEQGWTSAPVGPFETSQGAAVAAGVELDDGVGVCLRGIRIPATLVETTAVEPEEPEENVVAELDPAVSRNRDVDTWAVVSGTRRDADESSAPVVDVFVDVTGEEMRSNPEAGFGIVAVEADGLLVTRGVEL